MKTLADIIERLKKHPNVDAAFVTGSQGADHTAHSDIDLVIILAKHEHDLTSLYTWIEGKFADIFFFDHADMERIRTSKELAANDMDAIFVSWLQTATIAFDKSSTITAMKGDVQQLQSKFKIPRPEKYDFWQKINYNLVANKRYFASGNTLRHETLELRLLYSVSQVFTGYFEFRDIPWRGEKNALAHVRQHDGDFYAAFIAFTKATNLQEKFAAYLAMVTKVFPPGYEFWKTAGVYPQAKDKGSMNVAELEGYWKGLIS